MKSETVRIAPNLFMYLYGYIHINYVESVQYEFLKLAVRHSGHHHLVPFGCQKYHIVLNNFNLPALSNRRKFLDIVFVSNVAKGPISCSAIIRLLSLYILPRSLRNYSLVHTEHLWLF